LGKLIDVLYYSSFKIFLVFALCFNILCIGVTPKANAQNFINDIEKIQYTHYKTLVNGIFIHYVISGKGEPIVLLHGWPET